MSDWNKVLLSKKKDFSALSKENTAYLENVHDKRAVSSLTMVYANLIPMQFLGPWPKAMNDGGYRLLLLSSSKWDSGSKWRGFL